MHLLSLRLRQFRTYEQLLLLPPRGITVFVGENGSGKTNLLEAMHLCCLGKSHRTNQDREMIRFGSKTCAVHARIQRKQLQDEVGVRLFSQQNQRKMIYINGKIASRIGELMGHMTCVMFSPEDLDIVKGGPLNRRSYLDMLLSQSKPAYFYAIQAYATILKQRNALLKEIFRGTGDKQQLDTWDEQLARAAVPIVRLRRETTMSLSDLAGRHYSTIAGRKNEVFTMSYTGSLYDSPDLVEALIQQLYASREEDLRRLSTSVGPHKDDLKLMLSGQEMRSFASQGQARTAALSMRLAQIDVLTHAQQEAPLLLLDDVLSELDEGRQNRLLLLLDNLQTFITSTDLAGLKGVRPECVLMVKDGAII